MKTKLSLILSAALLCTASLAAQQRVPATVQGIPHPLAGQVIEAPRSSQPEAATMRTTIRTTDVQNINAADVQFWAYSSDRAKNPQPGDTVRTSYLLVKFNDNKNGNNALLWGYKWLRTDYYKFPVLRNGVESTDSLPANDGYIMLKKICQKDKYMAALCQQTQKSVSLPGVYLGYTIDGIGYFYNSTPGNIVYDLAGVQASPRISFKFAPPYATALGQTSAPPAGTAQYKADSTILAGLSATNGRGYIEHPFNAPKYGYACYDYDFWTCTNAAASWRAGWYTVGYWSYMTKSSLIGGYDYSSVGAQSRKLADNSVDLWTFADFSGMSGGSTTGPYQAVPASAAYDYVAPPMAPATAHLEARAIGSRISVSGVRGYEIEVFSLTTGRRICKIAATESDYQLPDTFLPDTYVLRAIGGGESRVAKLSIE